MDTEILRNYATVVAALVALLVFVVNSVLLVRNRRIENLSRFIQAHRRLFAKEGYLAANIAAIDTGRLTRDVNDTAMEVKFHHMLIEIEHLAILANNGAVPRHTQVYMFGWYTRFILPVITDKERNSMFWEQALGYLDGLARDTDRYEKLTRVERERFWH